MTRSFATLAPQEALHVAIIIEERNAEVYHRFAEMFVEFADWESLEIAGVFWEMAIEERRHSSMLQASYVERYGSSSCHITDDELAELIEVPRLNQSEIFQPGDSNDALAPRNRALQVALRAEISAHNYYAGLAEATHDEALRQMYHDLAHMEDGHVAYIEAKLTGDPTEENLVN